MGDMADWINNSEEEGYYPDRIWAEKNRFNADYIDEYGDDDYDWELDRDDGDFPIF